MFPDSLEIREDIFSDGGNYYKALLEDIAKASSSIDMETYIYDLDITGQQVADSLAAAALRGVSVRLLLDGVGSALWSNKIVALLGQAKVQVRIFRPLPWNISQWNWAPPNLTWLVKLRQLLTGIRHRNHRKICLIDHRAAWIGSFNISKFHLPREMGGDAWRDTAIRLEGVNFDELQNAFDSAWDDDRFRRLRKNFSAENFRLNYLWRRNLRRDLLKRISLCNTRIWITNAYFVPDLAFLRTLKKAARRGIDVRIILPRIADILFIPWVSAMFYRNLLKSGVRIFEYTRSVLHAKIMILDDWITIGSSNLDHLSLFYNLEVDAVVSLPSSKDTIRKQFLEDLLACQEVILGDLTNRPYWKKAIGRLFLSLKRWL
jgi:cardiolipin synthase